MLMGFRFFRRGGKIRAAIVSVMAIAVVVAFCIGSGLGGRFSLGKMTDGTSARLEKWWVVPRITVRVGRDASWSRIQRLVSAAFQFGSYAVP